MSGRSRGGLRRMVQRAGRGYRTFGRWLRVRYPYFSVLRPVFIGGWVVGTSILSAILAHVFRGKLYEPLDPLPLTIAWLLLSGVVAIVWWVRQWQERLRLPSAVAMPWMWSFMPTVIALLLILAPSFIWERLAYAEVRRLLSREDAGLLLGTTLEGISDVDERLHTLPASYAWLKERAPDPDTAEGALWKLSARHRRCSILFTDKYPDLRRRLENMDMLAHIPVVAWPDKPDRGLPEVQQHESDCARLLLRTTDKNAGRFDVRELAGSPDWPRVYAKAYDDLGQGRYWTYWEDSLHQTLPLLLVTVGAVFVILLNAMPLRRVVNGLSVQAVLVVCVLFVAQALDANGVLANRVARAGAWWLGWVFPTAAWLNLSLALWLWPRNRRSFRVDMIFAASWFLPEAIFGIESSLRLERYWLHGPLAVLLRQTLHEWFDYRADSANVLLGILPFYAVLSFFTPATFARYRNLPYDE